MKNELLREYLREILKEEFFYRSYNDPETKKPRSKGILQRMKDFFFGSSQNSLVDDWIEEQSTYYDVDLSDDFENEVREFVEKKFGKALSRAKGNKDQAAKLMRRALDIRYSKKLRDLERQSAGLSDDEV